MQQQQNILRIRTTKQPQEPSESRGGGKRSEQLGEGFEPIVPVGRPKAKRPADLDGKEQGVSNDLFESGGSTADQAWGTLCSWLDLPPKVDVLSLHTRPEPPALEHPQQKQEQQKAKEKVAEVEEDGGISGGKVGLADFLGTEPSKAEIARVSAEGARDDKATLAAHTSAISTGVARNERDMLIAIHSGNLPRYIARVSPRKSFGYGTFANPNRPFCFATEPADLRGVKPAEAMFKVGWTREWIEPNLGEEIVICIFDTHRAVPAHETAGPKAAKDTQAPQGSVVEQGKMGWPELTAVALADAKFIDAAEAKGIDKKDLAELFTICSQTPVKGDPRTRDTTKKRNCIILRELIDSLYGANRLYTGMGATMQENGKLGGREVMVKPSGTGLRLVDGNHVLVSIGTVTQEQLDVLFGSKK